MSIPEACIKAAEVEFDPPYSHVPAERRGRRVILALAENMPEDAVKAARDEFWVTWNSASNGVEVEVAMDDAIAAFLKHVAGETP